MIIKLREVGPLYQELGKNIPALKGLIQQINEPWSDFEALKHLAAECMITFAVEPYRDITTAMLCNSIYAMLMAYDAAKTYPIETRLYAVKQFTNQCLHALKWAAANEIRKRPELLETLKIPLITANVEPMKLLE